MLVERELVANADDLDLAETNLEVVTLKSRWRF